MAYGECRNLSFSYEDVPVLKGLDLDIYEGECLGIVGANGTGKSTLLQLMVGLKTGFGGSLSLGGLEVNSKNLEEIRRRTGFVFQDFDAQLFMPTAYEDVSFGLDRFFSKEEALRKTEEIFKVLGVENLKKRYTHRMSGGEKKLISLATVLVREPECIIFDEPTTGLDPKNRNRLKEIIKNLGGTKIIATHDLNMAMEICSETALLSGGKITARGKPEEILLNKKLMEENNLALPYGYEN